MCFLSGLSFAFPKNKVYQSEIKHLSAKLFSSKINFKNMEKIYENSGVKSRFLVNELEWYLDYITQRYKQELVFRSFYKSLQLCLNLKPLQHIHTQKSAIFLHCY